MADCLGTCIGLWTVYYIVQKNLEAGACGLRLNKPGTCRCLGKVGRW